MPRQRPAPAAAPGTPTDWRLLAAIVAVGAAVRVWLATQNSGMTMDSPLYVEMAEQLARGGHGLLGPAHHGYPGLIALASALVPGRELPGRVVSFAAGLLLIVLVERIARRVLPPRPALAGATCVALHPLLAVFSGPIMTETSFLALLYAGLLAAVAGRGSVAGVLLGLSYTVRPEGLLVAVVAVLASVRRPRFALAMATGCLVVAAPYVGYLSQETGRFSLTPKSALVRPALEDSKETEWQVGDVNRPFTEPDRNLIERFQWAAPSIATHYVPNFVAHGRRVLEAWPAPLLVLSLLGLSIAPRLLFAPFAYLLVLPMLAVAPNLRFPQVLVPALAVLAACGAHWLTTRAPKPAARWAPALAITLAAGGMAWEWVGQAGKTARGFDDGPDYAFRAAGGWLRLNGEPNALVMDRKPYVPFYAGMRHAHMPDDDYDTVVEYARATGVHYLVLEEHVMRSMRRQFVPLMSDPEFRSREPRLRMVYAGSGGEYTGVAIFKVVR